MNYELFNKLIEHRPSQHSPEFLTYLEFCEMYLKRTNIKNPIIVELGVYHNKQKVFYEQLLSATHIGIDTGLRRSIPDIHGSTHSSRTLRRLKEKLNGRMIDILFIDADHVYESVKLDFEIYSPLCSGVVAFHDIHTYRDSSRQRARVWQFWDELRVDALTGRKYRDFLFVSIHKFRSKVQMGIGMIIKR